MTRSIIRAVIAAALLASSALAQQILINGTGATFPYPMYSKWFDVYHKKYSNIQINYNSLGSGAGVQQVTAGTVDFGASDMPMTDDELKGFRDKNGYGVLHFPTVMGANVPAYKLPGVSQQLNFTGEALADIFLGKITKWNDPALAKANPGVSLPSTNIVVVHRSDGSGTTFVWTDYLAKVSPEWKTKVGAAKSVNWPVGLGGKGNEGVAGQVQNTPNSLGYIELTYAMQNKIQYGKVKNAAGVFISADLAGVTAAAAGAIKEVPEDFRVSITNAPGKASYPISTFTYLLVPEKFKDPAKKKAITDFLKWMLTEGQTQTEALVYAPLPKAMVTKETKAIAKIQ
ncbi:MAG TPA: phosphate ABC transporter substrate-binding protein PstS [Bryobacteraceae bacterium]|nr:phosphate ABC transporter substrate-binding protein PstS [Bryobacteraceae bacterium]